MGLRCLLGHEYANREVEREREERGDEVVVTYRTVETCDRCGERRVVSENKEVRPIRDPREDDVATGLGGGGVTADLDEPSASDDAPAAASEEAPAAGGDPAPTADTDADEGSTPAATASTGDDGGPAGDDGTPTPDPAEEDAVILDDGATEDGDDGRARGEWPGTDAERPDDAEEPGAADADADAATNPEPADDGTTVVSGDEGWPEPGSEGEGFDAEPSDGTPTDVSFGGGLTPEGADAAANGEAEATSEAGAVAGKQFVAAEEVEPVSEESAGRTEFFCPNCGYVRTAGGSSMRAGDICPDCHKGYIAERERAE
ncbi:DUF7093 family protein [Haloplanus rubicundus]|uniref:Uncharacterized protein n=1 Tax=Haloplanus rubicundus TaxID=1547898 RepID=A0A345EHC9_9EURY|nr:hypothetical protein [Haloplanus rubicundus]AXG11601.1 hypothetical protein DU484_18035 [Haloplanus rubicundus]